MLSIKTLPFEILVFRPPLSQAHIDGFIKQVDKNGDGTITKMELFEFTKKSFV